MKSVVNYVARARQIVVVSFAAAILSTPIVYDKFVSELKQFKVVSYWCEKQFIYQLNRTTLELSAEVYKQRSHACVRFRKAAASSA